LSPGNPGFSFCSISAPLIARGSIRFEVDAGTVKFTSRILEGLASRGLVERGVGIGFSNDQIKLRASFR
jgi:hypothetical protein